MVHIIGNYICDDDKIGRGSFATVYRGRHKVTNKLVAIKDIYVEKMPPQYLDMEISIMKEMSHPCIVELIDCIRTDSHVYLIMEYCSLGDLNLFLINNYGNKGMPESDLIHFVEQMASALKYLRQRNFVHRDIKPQNILLVPGKFGTKLPDLKISDFGFAKFLPNTDLTSSYCGSPLYMAPEVIERKSYDARADLWSVGVMLYEMMMGRKMIETNHMVELQSFLKYYNNQVDFTGAHYHFSTELKDLIRVLLKKNPADRASCEDFFHHVQLLLPPEDDEYVVVNTSHTSLDSISMNRYSSSAPSQLNQRRSLDPNHYSFQEPLPIKRSRKFSVGSASSVFTKALSIASTKIFGSSSSENNSPPSPLTPMTPPHHHQQQQQQQDEDEMMMSSILLEEITLDRLLISCKDTMETEKIVAMVTAIEQLYTSNSILMEQVIVLNHKIKTLLQYGIKSLYTFDDQKVSDKLIDLNVWMVNKLNTYQQKGNQINTDICVERLLYDKALELSRQAAMKQLIHEDLSDCIYKYKQAILILESIIIDDSQNVLPQDQDIIQKFINTLQSRLNNVLTIQSN